MKSRFFGKVLAAFALLMSVSFLTPEVGSLGLDTVSVEAAAVKLNAKKKTIAAGKKFNLKLKNVSRKARITWKTSNKKIASIKSNGANCTVTGKKKGTATIRAKVKLNGKTASYQCKVTVNAVPALSEKSKKLGKYDNFILTLSNAEKEARWSVSNQNILALKRVAKNKYRVIPKKKVGKANVTVVYDGKKYVCKVNVVNQFTVKKEESKKEDHDGSDGRKSGVTGKGNDRQESTEKETEPDYYFSLSIDKSTVFVGDTAKITVKTNAPHYYLDVKYPDDRYTIYDIDYDEHRKYVPPAKVSSDETVHIFRAEGKVTAEVVLSYLGEVKDVLTVTVTDIYKQVDGLFTLEYDDDHGWKNYLKVPTGEINGKYIGFYANPSLSGKRFQWHCTGVHSEILTYTSTLNPEGKHYSCEIVGVTPGTDTLTLYFDGEPIASCKITVFDASEIFLGEGAGHENLRTARQEINRIINECAKKVGIEKVDKNLSKENMVAILSEFCTYMTENYRYATRDEPNVPGATLNLYWMFIEGGSGHCGTSAQAIKYVAQNLFGLEARYIQFGNNEWHVATAVEMVEGEEYWVFNGTPNKNGKSYVAKPDGNGGWEVDYEVPKVGGLEEVFRVDKSDWDRGY